MSPLKLGAVGPERSRLTARLPAPLWPGWRGEAGGAVGGCWDLGLCCGVFRGDPRWPAGIVQELKTSITSNYPLSPREEAFCTRGRPCHTSLFHRNMMVFSPSADDWNQPSSRRVALLPALGGGTPPRRDPGDPHPRGAWPLPSRDPRSWGGLRKRNQSRVLGMASLPLQRGAVGLVPVPEELRLL